jgi:hypothetical protein
MAYPTYAKAPAAVLDYGWDWSEWLAEMDDTVASYTITPDDGLTLDSDYESEGIITAWLSGGTASVSYNVVCQVVTTGGRTDERTITIDVDAR